MTASIGHRFTGLLAACALLAVLFPLSASATAAGEATAAPRPKPTSCSVAVGKGKPGSDLQAAINTASPGSTISVKGTCAGHFRIDAKSLTLNSGSKARAVLDGNGTAGTVLSLTGQETVTLTDITVSNGAVDGANASGGGIYLELGTLNLTGASLVTGNTATGTAAYPSLGGGIFTLSGTVNLSDSANVIGNSAATGGGIYAYEVSSRVNLSGSSRVTDNTATSGGGIHAYLGTVSISGKSAVSANEAVWGGAISSTGIVLLSDSATVSGNTATAEGGGIYNQGALAFAGAASVTGNAAATYGGGIRSVGGTVSVDAAWTGSTCTAAEQPERLRLVQQRC